jgi:predicted Ser/Thr protein kinase
MGIDDGWSKQHLVNSGERVAVGSSGEVFRIRNKGGEDLALKLAVNESRNGDIINEAEVLQKLKAAKVTGVPIVLGMMEKDKRKGLIMEYLDKDWKCLDKISKNEVVQISTEDKLFICANVARTLHSANRLGIIYNDIGIKNVFWNDRELGIKVVDWANSQPVDAVNKMKDVEQFKKFVAELFGFEFGVVDKYIVTEDLSSWLGKSVVRFCYDLQ